MRYSYGIIVLHWSTAVLMFALATSGLLYSYKIVGSNALIFHQWGGQLLLVLALIASYFFLGEEETDNVIRQGAGHTVDMVEEQLKQE